jgi:hypothetical protein
METTLFEVLVYRARGHGGAYAKVPVRKLMLRGHSPSEVHEMACKLMSARAGRRFATEATPVEGPELPPAAEGSPR